MLRAACILLLVLACGKSQAQEKRHPFDLLSSVAVDATGCVVGTDPIDPGTLRVWEDGAWNRWDLGKDFQGWSPVRLARASTGDLGVFWHRRKERNEWKVAWTRGREVLGSADFVWDTSPTNELSVTEAPDGALWLSARTPSVVETRPPEAAKKPPATATVCDLSSFFAEPDSNSWNPVNLIASDQGDVWVFVSQMGSGKPSEQLERVLHKPKNSETWLPGPSIPKQAVRPYVSMVQSPEGTPWIGDNGGNIFGVVPGEDQMREFPSPPGRSQGRLAKTWSLADGTMLVLAGNGTMQELWTFGKKGWRTLIPAQSFVFAQKADINQSLVELPEGLLMNGTEGLIWLPRTEADDGSSRWGEAQLLNWEDGFPLVRVEQILKLPDGTLGIRASRDAPRRWWTGTLEDLLAGLSPSPRTQVIRDLHCGLAVDAEDRVYTFFPSADTFRPVDERVLKEWSGGKWRDISLPENLRDFRPMFIEVDDNQRVVIYSRYPSEPVVLLAPDRKTWGIFYDYFTALLDLGKEMRGLRRDHYDWRPAISSDGLIAFANSHEILFLWDGSAWRDWKMEDFFTPEKIAADPLKDEKRPWLQEPKRRISAEQFGIPFLAKDGRIAVNTRYSSKTWFWNGIDHWVPGPKETGPWDQQENLNSNSKQEKLPQRAVVPGRVRSIKTDNLGTTWIVAGGNLHRHRNGKTVALFSKEETHPFMSEPRLEEVRVDGHGFVWFQTRSSEFVLLRPLAAPEFQPEFHRREDGVMVLEELPPWSLEWSTDGHTWFLLTDGVFGFLPPRDTSLSLRLVAEDLSLHPLPTVALPATEDAPTFWARMIEILLEGEREQKLLALDACERNPAEAIPVLREALKKSDSKDDWWLRVALQTAERSGA